MKKVVAALLLVIFFVSSVPAFAQGVGNPDDPNGYKISQKEFQEYTAAVENCETPSLECLVRYTTRFVAMEWVNEILGKDNKIVEPAAGSSGSSVTPESTVASRPSFVSGTFNLISLMYANPIADTQTYVADVMDSAGLAPKAYAQGVGFASLNPILNLWKGFRNISYFFFILLFIVIGFMIMFRQKIGGQAAVTAQQAIPSIVVSLVLVTFSYAIAGFMIDLMYLSMFMIVGVFTDIIQSEIAGQSGNQLINMNIFQLIGTLFSAIWHKDTVTQNLLTQILDSVANAGAGSGLTSFVGMIGGLTLSLVISIAVLIGAFRLFFELLKSYFSVIVSVVTAPVMLMLGAIPGKNVFWPWLKNIIGNLAAFPTVLLVLVLFLEFSKDGNSNTAGGFMPPFLVGTGQAGIIGPLMGFATILALPDVVKKVKTTLGASEGGPLWELAGAALNNAKTGLPLGLRTAGGTIGAAVGTAAALPNAYWQTRGQGFTPERLETMRKVISRGAGNGLDRGTRFGAGASSTLGGRSPGVMTNIDKAVDTLSKQFNDESRLKRLAENRNVFGGTTGTQGENTYQRQEQLAEARRQKQRYEEERLLKGKYGIPVDKA